MSDPRQEDRLREEPKSRPFVLPTQCLERIKQGLSPCDDELPFAQAVRQRRVMQDAVEELRKLRDAPPKTWDELKKSQGWQR